MGKLQQALAYIEAGNIDKGLTLLSELEKDANEDLMYILAEAYYELGHLEKAHKIIDQLLDIYPNDGELLAYKAELLIDLDNEDEAINLLTDINEDDPAYLKAQLLLADLYQMQGFDEVAEQKLLKVNELVPDDPHVAFALGDFYLSRSDYHKSIPYFKQLYYDEENAGMFHKGEIELKLAEAFSGIGEFEEALEFYEKGLKEKTQIHALFQYGYIAFQLERYDVAIKQFQKLKELEPNYAGLYPYLAKCFEAKDMLDEALKTLKEGMEIDEFNEALYVHAAKLCFKKQDPKSGEKFLKQVIQLNPSFFEAIRTYAAFLKHEERYQDLLQLIEKYKETGEEDPLIVWYEAYCLHKEEEFEKAKERFSEAYKYFANDPDFLEDYSLFFLENGYKKDALEMMEKALQIDGSKHHLQEMAVQLQEEIY